MDPPDSFCAIKFPRSIRLQFPKFSKGFSVSDFDEFIKSIVGVKNVKNLGRLCYPNEWMIELTSETIRENLIRLGRTKVKGRTCWIHPLNSSEVRGFIHWLPTEIPNEVLINFLSEFGEVLQMEEQKLNKWAGKVNFDSRYFALFLKPGKSVEDVPHFMKMDEYLGLITIKGRSPACFHCREVGHKKTECKKYTEKLNGYCSRNAGQGAKRGKPRGKRYNPDVKAGMEVKQTTEGNLETEQSSEKPNELCAADSNGNNESLAASCETSKKKKKRRKKKKNSGENEVSEKNSANSDCIVEKEVLNNVQKMKKTPEMRDVGTSTDISDVLNVQEMQKPPPFEEKRTSTEAMCEMVDFNYDFNLSSLDLSRMEFNRNNPDLFTIPAIDFNNEVVDFNCYDNVLCETKFNPYGHDLIETVPALDLNISKMVNFNQDERKLYAAGSDLAIKKEIGDFKLYDNHLCETFSNVSLNVCESEAFNRNDKDLCLDESVTNLNEDLPDPINADSCKEKDSNLLPPT